MQFISDITVRCVQQMGGDLSIVRAARVSTLGGPAVDAEESPDAQRGLIRYLMRHRHGTPFECGAATFLVHAPIFVWREWHRHRWMSFNEESGRYKTLDPVFYIPPRDRPMMKVEGWKPGRPKFLTLDEHAANGAKCSRCKGTGNQWKMGGGEESCSWCDGDAKFRPDIEHGSFCSRMRATYAESYKCYEGNLAMGVDPGLARDCLPVGIYSSCYVTANPRAIMAFLSLRTHDEDAAFVSYPLYEIEVAAKALESIFAESWPFAHAAFNEFGRVAP